MEDCSFTYKGAHFVAREEGKGPAVVFLHGFLENQSMWDELWSALPKQYRKISLDLPGHGGSENLSYIHTMEEMAEVVKALLDRLRLRKVVLVGHSMGGYVALAFAEAYPDMLKAMVLMNSTSRADSDERKINRDRAIALVKRNHKSYIRNAIPMLFRPKSRTLYREQVAAVKKEALKTSLQGVVAALEGMKRRIDREVILNFAPYPILLVAAKKDPVLGWDDLAEQFEHAAVQSLELSEGHMSHIENFVELMQGLKSFLRQNA